MSPPPARARWRRAVRAALRGLGGGVALLVAAFAWNGLAADWERPDVGETETPSLLTAPRELRVLAYNVAKLGLFEGQGARSPDAVREHLREIAALIRAQDPHVVLLSEVVAECGPCPVDQARFLAETSGMHAWAFGEEVDFGLPGYRIRSGNAILTRLELRPLQNEQLAGARPFWWPANNRRVLWCELDLGGSDWLRVGAIHTDSRDLDNCARQVREQLDALGERPALLGGDFNAWPGTPPFALLEAHGLVGAVREPATFPSERPRRRIDHVLAPRGWALVRSEVLDTTLSDHRPVLSVFRRPD